MGALPPPVSDISIAANGITPPSFWLTVGLHLRKAARRAQKTGRVHSDAPGRADGYFSSGEHRDLLALARAELEHGIADQTQTDAVADRAGDRHGDEHGGHRQALINVVKVDLLETAEHEQADVDERGARRSGGDDGGDGRKEHARKEEHAGRQSGKKIEIAY